MLQKLQKAIHIEKTSDHTYEHQALQVFLLRSCVQCETQLGET